MHDELFDEINALETRHWWYRARRRIVLMLLERHLGGLGAAATTKVCDLGCGCGLILHDLAERGYQVAGLDPSPKAVEYCASRGLTVLTGSLPDDAASLPGPFDAVLLLDVLEHLPDDRAALATAVRLLTPGGLLLLTVPAFPWFWSRHDERYSHLRRYTRTSLDQLLHTQPQARIELLSYMNTVLFPAAIVSRLASRLVASRDLSARSVEWQVPPAPLNGFLEALFAAERHWLARGRPLPFGLSLVAVVRV